MSDPRWFEINPAKHDWGRKNLAKVTYIWSYDEQKWYAMVTEYDSGERRIELMPFDDPGRKFFIEAYRLGSVAGSYSREKIESMSPCDLEDLSRRLNQDPKSRRPSYLPGTVVNDLADVMLGY